MKLRLISVKKQAKRIFIIPFCLLMFFSCKTKTPTPDSQEDLYARIDQAIEKVSEYDAEKEKRISSLKERLFREKDNEIRSGITDLLITEYEAYISDSALYYINLNLVNPVVASDKKKREALQIKLGDVLAHAGLFNEASNVLGKINRELLDPSLLENYYSAYCDLYQYQIEYLTDSDFARQHEETRELYVDSISMVASENSMNYVANKAAKLAREGNFKDAENLLLQNIDLYQSGDRNYSILASILADLYRQKGDNTKYNKYLSLSVISDLEGAVKENMAIRALATECYKEGDFERADRYLRQSFADANFYAARMRNAQSSQMLPVIGEAYVSQQKSMHTKLTLFIIFISVLAFGFIIISIFAILQVKKVRTKSRETKRMLEEVSRMSDKLASLNQELTNANEELKNSNEIRTQYGVLFMEYCSLAISSLQKYQQSLKVAALQGNFQNLKKRIESSQVEINIISEFYKKFDEAILNIYPDFVEKFNSLLLPEERMELKKDESLNTELRIFALMKIGITDPEKIADFLRCSLSTVYTYRSKTKKKALDPDSFEEEILLI